MRPAFDAETLHYSIGCADSDSMSLTFAAADAQSRLSVDGTAYANPGAEQSLTATVSVGGQSDVTISLSNATGGETQYVVHCMADDFGEFTSVKSTGATEELLLVPRGPYLLILDNNAVPRYRRHLVDHEAQTYFRFYQNGGDGEYRYSYSVAHNRGHVILDEHLEEISRASTVSPLTTNDTHDFRVLDSGNYLLMTYEPGVRDFSSLTFLDSNGAPFGTDVHAVDSAIQIVTPLNSARLTWNSWDHMPLEDCTHHWFPPAFGRWAHVNSIEMTGGEIVASFRGCNRILGIDPSTGKVNWRIGPTNLSDAEWASSGMGPAPMDIVGDPQIQFCGQHSASILPNGNLLLYDNGANCSRNPWTGENLVRPDRTYGRAVEYYLDFEHDEVVYVREHSLNGTKNYIGWVGGNVSALENGDWLISWGRDRLPGNAPIPDGPPFSVDLDATQVDPATGEEVLSLDWNPDAQEGVRVTAMPAYALARQPRSLVATLPVSSTTSLLHSGANDRPQIVVTFNHPIADFDQTSPSLSIQAATVESVRSHVVNGESANTYLVTLTPDGDGAISFRLVTGQACAAGGICMADGTMLSAVPAALVIGPAVTVSFEQATYTVTEGASRSVAVRLSSAHQGVRSVTIPVVLRTTGSASADDLTLDESVTFEAGEHSKPLALNATDDDLVEGAETATIEFGTLPDGVTAPSTSTDTLTLTLTDADQAEIDFTTGAAQVSEGGETQLSFTITNGVTFEVDQAINLTVGGTATAGDDFTLVDAANQTLSAPYAVTFPVGATSAEATIRAVDDSDIEYVAETITVSAQLALTGANLGLRTVTIPPSDVPDTPVVSIAAGGAVSEGQDATFTLSRTVSQSLPLSAPLTVSVEVTATGSTLSGATPSSATFEAGSATATVEATTLDDSVVEPPGTVTALVRGSTSNPPVYLTELPNLESTDRSLKGRAAGLPERSAGVPAFAGRCRSEEPSLSVAQRGSGALRAPARGCARRARACWREPRTRVGAVSERQAGSGNARNRARAAAHWPAQGQRFARCRVQRRAEWVSRPARAK